MMKRTVTLTCKKCGRQFTYTCGDAVMPNDRDIIAQSLCSRCRRKTLTINRSNAY